jgi:hypothetical protein
MSSLVGAAARAQQEAPAEAAPEPVPMQAAPPSSPPSPSSATAAPQPQTPAAQRSNDVAAPRAHDAAATTRDGTFLPTTVSARIGNQRVIGMVLGGYDTTGGQGGLLSGVVEGALFHRVALRIGADYVAPLNTAKLSAAVRVNILSQERFGVDLGLALRFNQVGFTESNGEFESMVLIGRRWNRAALFGNAVFGVGIDPAERDGEVRAAFLYSLTDRLNLGLDARGRFDLGDDTPGRAKNKLESDFDLVAGPLVTYSIGPVQFMAQAGAHTLVQHEVASGGFVALGGVGAVY